MKTSALIQLHIKALREHTVQQYFVKRQQYDFSRTQPIDRHFAPSPRFPSSPYFLRQAASPFPRGHA